MSEMSKFGNDDHDKADFTVWWALCYIWEWEFGVILVTIQLFVYVYKKKKSVG